MACVFPERTRLGATVLFAVAAALCARASPPDPAVQENEPAAFAARVAALWNAHDLGGWMALWDLPAGEARSREQDEAREAFAGGEATLSWLRPPVLSADGTLLTADAQVFVSKEPRARVVYWRLTARRGDGGWALTARQEAGQIDGLVHLSLARDAWHAHGVSLRLEDFELRLEDGTLYATSEAVGPTALVFVGRARVRFEPKPPSEREQLRQFSGSRALDHEVDWAYVRLHPADFRRVLEADRLQPEPDAEARRQRAEEVFRARASKTFLLDAPLPRSPWWLLPALGDAVVDFPWHRHVLTYALSGSEAEDVNFFDRDRHLQICMYPSAGRPLHYDEDAGRAMDLLDQELSVRFEPDSLELSAVDVMHVRPLGGAGTLRLRLDDDFDVASLRTGEGDNLLFFRVRGQNMLVVSLGSLADHDRPLTLVVRYSGRHNPAPMDQELLQLSTNVRQEEEQMFIEQPPLVYSNRTSWYPRPPSEDFATARLTLDTPEGWLAVTGGELRSLRTEARRTRAEYRLAEPGKFLTAVVGRLSDVGLRQQGAQSVRGYAVPRLRSQAAGRLQRAEEILAYYAERFGPCPYPAIGVVLAEGETPGGHSPPGLVYLQARPPVLRSHLADDPANFSDLPDFFLAHELAHQWWGQGTAPSSYRERWLSEAWAQYAAALWVRSREGEGAFHGMMDRMARWALRDDQAGPIELGQRLGSLKGDPRIFRAVVYDKGAWVLHMLRGIVGDDAFFRGARAFLSSHRFAKADSDDLRRALEQASGQDLRAYFARWIDDTGLPTVRWRWHTRAVGSGFSTTVEARPEDLPGPVPLEITLAASAAPEARRVVLEPGGGSWTIATGTRPGRVTLNDDRGLLARFDRVSRLPPLQR